VSRLRSWPGNVLRFFVIATVFWVTLVAYGFARLGTLFTRDRDARRIKVGHLRGRLLRWQFTVLGATFIKMGQVMSSRPDLFGPEMIEELRSLQDEVPAFPFEKVRRIVEQDLAAPLDQLFAEFDPEPVAAASVAQVHRARLHPEQGGGEVAVKVLRPNVRQRVQRDGAIIVTFTRLLHLSPKLRASDPVGHVSEFVRGVIEQTDLRVEARNYGVFQTNFAGFPEVVFPALTPQRCSERVLTMAFVEGRKLDTLGPGPHPEVAKITREMFLQMCFKDGVVHADLHPGNMFLLADGRVAVFDVGLVLHVPREVLVQLVDFARCIAAGTWEDFVAHLKRFHTYMEDVDWGAVELDAKAFVERFRDQATSDLEWASFSEDLFRLAREHNIRPMPEMTLILVGVITAEGIGKMLAPQSQTFHEIAAYIMPLLPKLGLSMNPTQKAG